LKKKLQVMKFPLMNKALKGFLIFLCLSFQSIGQDRQVIDEIVGVVGNEVILKSDIQQELQGLMARDTLPKDVMRCRLVKNGIEKNLLLNKAEEDSVVINQAQVESQLNRRMQYFIDQLGSREKLEQYYQKSIPEIKEEMREPIRERLISRQMRNKLIGDVQVSPSQVKMFFENMSKDSLPYYNTQVEVGKVVRYASPTEQEKQKARKRLQEIRSRILEGSSTFDNMAILYSDDQTTATKGGDMGMRSREDLHPKIAASGMELGKDSISKVIKTDQGFHIVQLLNRRGENLHLKQIIIKAKINSRAMEQTRQFLDSIKHQTEHDTLTFDEAALHYSQDEQTKNNGGLMKNQQNGSTKIPVDQLNSEVFFTIDTMDLGDVSKPLEFEDAQKGRGYQLLYLKNKIDPHKANLEKDYPQIRQMALNKKKQEKMREWFHEYSEQTYIRIEPSYHDCSTISYYKQQSN